jgi:hypothetical protein
MNRIKIITLALLTLLGALPATSAIAENRALIIGIGQGYDGPNKLQGPEKDASMAQEIALGIGIPAENTRVLLDRNANRENVIAGMKWVQEGVQNGGRAFIYYSGHGYQIEDKGGNPEDEGCDEVIVPVDLKFVIDKEIKVLLQGMAKAEVLLMADSCFSGTIHKGLYGGNLPFAKVLKKVPKGVMACAEAINEKKSLGLEADTESGPGKLIVLSATNKHEVAYASTDGRGGSMFTQAVYDTLQAKGYKVSFREVIDDAREKVRQQSESQNMIKHTPQLDGNPEYFDWAFDFSGKVGEAPQQTVETTRNNQEMIDWLVNNSKYAVSIVSDRKQIRMGEKIGFEVFSSQEGYINILENDPEGVLTVLFPNQYKSNNSIRANSSLRVPNDIGGFKITGQGTPGDSKVLVLVTTEPLNLYSQGGGEKVRQFKVFSRKDMKALKATVRKGLGRTRSLGVQKDDSSNQDFGANAITITVSR